MEKEQKSHILKNIVKLINCTKDESSWYNHLLEYGFMSQSTWQSINKNESDTDSRIREIYFHCMKTPCYDLLIQSLKDCNNHTASKILEEFEQIDTTATVSKLNNKASDFIWFDIRPPTTHHKGRDDEVQKIEDCWQKSLKNKSLIFMSITGLGGVGKSELAKIFLKKVYTETQCHCIWINSESAQTISDSFQRLATKIGISLFDYNGNEKSVESISLDVFNQLGTEKSIFAFDNIDGNEELTAFKSLVTYANQLAPNKFRPFCLITSRYKLINKEFGNLVDHLHLNVLSENSAVQFFNSSLNISTENPIISDIKTISGKLEYYPLAMQQAVAYIRAMKLNDEVATGIKKYLEDFEKETKKLLNYPMPLLENLDNVSITTYPIWQITLNRISTIPEVGTEAEHTLNIISLLHPDNISVEFLKKINEEINFSVVLKILDDYSMCHMTNVDNKSFVSIHRLVQEVTRIRLSENCMFSGLVDDLLARVFLLFVNNKVFDSDMIHVEAIWNHATKLQQLIEKFKLLPGKIVNKYYDSGRYNEELQFINGAVKTLESVLGKNYRCSLKLIYWQACVFEELGNYECSLRILKQVFEKQISFFGEEDEDALATAKDIAWAQFRLGNLEEAQKLTIETLKIRNRVSGTNNIETLKLKNIVACLLQSTGKPKEALRIHKEVLSVRKTVLGSNHPGTLATKHNIACIKSGQGKLDEAILILQKILHVMQQSLDQEHPDIFFTAIQIGRIKYLQKEYTNSFKIFAEFLPIIERLYGKQHKDAITCRYFIEKIQCKWKAKK